MKKILLLMTITASFLFGMNVQTASKDELICIKGIGEKKANAILKYRKSTKIKSVKDLLEVKGFGKVLINNIENEIKSMACGGKKTVKKKSKKKSEKKVSKKKSDKKETKKKSDKKESKKKSDKKSSIGEKD